MIKFFWKSFTELNIYELYDILKLRASIFVVEQHCPYLDPDGKDTDAIHCIGLAKNKFIAYLRVIKEKDRVVFGRIVTHPNVRSKGYGKEIMQEMLRFCMMHFPNVPIVASAQYHLIRFYKQFGFLTVGDVYDEDGIPHIMITKT